MSLQTKINDDLVTAMKSRDAIALRTLRAIKSAITNMALVKAGNVTAELSDADVLSVIRKQIQQRTDSIAQYEKAGRPELSQIEKEEVDVLNQYLPAELPDEAIDSFIRQAIEYVNATSKKDMRKVLERANELCNNAVDNRVLSQKVAKLLP